MIVVECYLDEYLVKLLGLPKRLIKHQHGKGKVMKFLREYGSIGIVDEDPYSAQPKDLCYYEEIENSENIKLLQRKGDQSKHLIVISDNMEDWIAKRAKINNISMKEYGLPSDPDRMHNIPHIERKREFKAFLQNLVNIDDEIILLKTWLMDNLK